MIVNDVLEIVKEIKSLGLCKGYGQEWLKEVLKNLALALNETDIQDYLYYHHRRYDMSRSLGKYFKVNEKGDDLIVVYLIVVPFLQEHTLIAVSGDGIEDKDSATVKNIRRNLFYTDLISEELQFAYKKYQMLSDSYKNVIYQV